MLTLILFTTFLQVPDPPVPNGATGMPPSQGVASIDARGTLTIARVQPFHGMGMSDQEVWLKAPEKKAGEKVMIKAKVTQMVVTVVELPAHVVEGYTVDGKPIPASKLAELLAKERTVLIALDGKKVDPFHLQLYKEGTIILVPPGNLAGLQDPTPYTVPVPTPFGPPMIAPREKIEVRPLEKVRN